MYKCKWNLNKGSYIIKIKTIVIPLLPNFLSPIMNRSCQTLFLLFMYFIATARLSHGLDSVERESSVGAFLLRLRLLTSLSISHYALPAWFCHFTLILHLTCLENWTRSYRQCRPVPPVAAKGGPYNHDGVPKITWIWGPRDAHIYGVCKFLWHRYSEGVHIMAATNFLTWRLLYGSV